MSVYVSVRVHEGTVRAARDAWSFPNMATGLHSAVSTFHARDSAKKTVSINKQLLRGVQVGEDGVCVCKDK